MTHRGRKRRAADPLPDERPRKQEKQSSNLGVINPESNISPQWAQPQPNLNPENENITARIERIRLSIASKKSKIEQLTAYNEACTQVKDFLNEHVRIRQDNRRNTDEYIAAAKEAAAAMSQLAKTLENVGVGKKK